MLVKIIYFVTFSCILGLNVNAQQKPIEIEINGLRNSNGRVILNIYTEKENFDKEEPETISVFPKTNIKDSTLFVELENMPPKIYGIALIDDENDNGKLDRRFLIPQEGFGFSNYVFSSQKKPQFEQFSITHTDKVKTKTTIQVFYF